MKGAGRVYFSVFAFASSAKYQGLRK